MSRRLIAVNDVMSVEFYGDYSTKRGLMRVANKAVRERYRQLGIQCPRQPSYSLFTAKSTYTRDSYIPITFDGEDIIEYDTLDVSCDKADMTPIQLAIYLSQHGKGMYKVARTHYEMGEGPRTYYSATVRLNWFDGVDAEQRAMELVESSEDYPHIVNIQFISDLFTWCSHENRFFPTCDTVEAGGSMYSKAYYEAHFYHDSITGADGAGRHIDYWVHGLGYRLQTSPENEGLMTRCEGCGKLYLTSSYPYGFFSDVAGHRVCKDCADNAVVCHCCGRVTVTPRRVGLFDYCPECARNEAYVECYSHTYAEPSDFRSIDGNGDSLGLYLGVELETEDDEQCDRGTWACLARDAAELSDGHRNFVETKSDSTLSRNGVEIVTMPATPAYHLNKGFWEKLTELGGERNVTASSNCGLHVHVNRSFFGNDLDEDSTTIERIVSRFKDQWVLLSNRECFNWCRILSDEELELFPEDCLRRKRKTAKDNKHCSHSYAINHGNRETIEFRFFAGTMDLWRIRADIEAVAAVAITAKAVGNGYGCVEDWGWGELTDQLLNSLKRNKLPHSDLEHLLKEKGL